jgi:hypothetical protein
VNTAAGVSATGNVTGGNVLTAGQISAGSNITGANLVTGGLISAAGQITGSQFNGSGAGLTSILGANVTGTVPAATVAATVTTAAQPNITSVGTLSSLTVTGNATAGNVYANSGTIGASLLTGTLTTAAQPNITSVGTLSSLSVTGNIAAGNLTTVGVLSVTGTGVSSISGNLDMTSNNIINLATPVSSTDAATKQYVDDLASTALVYHEGVTAATTDILANATSGTVTYNNGTAGVGATLTTTGTFNLIDTANVQTVGTRILVKNEANAAHNGVYTYTSTTVITRATDADSYGPGADELSLNNYFFVSGGDVNKGSAYVLDSPTGTITFGTSNILFAQFSSSQVYLAGTGLTLSNLTFSVNASQTQITAVGTLGSLSVSGNINGGNLLSTGAVSTSGNVSGAFILGNGSQLTGLPAGYSNAQVASYLASGTNTSNIITTANVLGGNLTTTGLVTAVGNVIGGNLSTAGLVTATGNITGGNLTTTGLVTATGNIDGGNLRTAGQVSATGNITGSNILTAGQVSAAGNVNTAAGVSATGNVTGGNILTSGQVSATGNITGGNLSVSTGNITAGNILLSGAILDSAQLDIQTTATNANIVLTPNGTGNVNIGRMSASGNITASTYFGTIGTAAQTNITSLGTLTSLSVSGDIDGGNLRTAGLISATGNITGGNILGGANVNATTHTGTTVSVTSNIDGGNLRTAGLISATGNITGSQFNGSGAGLTSIPNGALTNSAVTVNGTSISLGSSGTITANTTAALTFSGAGTGDASGTTFNGETARTISYNSVGAPSTTGTNASGTWSISVTGSAGTAATVTTAAQPNITSVGTLTALTVTGSTTSGNLLTGGLISATGQVTGSQFNGSGAGLTSIPGGNVTGTVANATFATSAGTVTTAAQPNITSVGILSSLSVSGNIDGGNLRTAGLISATGQITGSGLAVGSGSITGGNITVGGAISASGLISSAGNITGVGNITGGNILTAGQVSAAGNVNTASGVSATGNITGGNLRTAGLISATGNITGGNILGGANVNATTHTGTTVSVTGNITGGNILGGANVNATTHTGTTVSVTGNIDGGNLRTAGLLSVNSGNVTSAVIVNAGANGVGNIGSTTNYFGNAHVTALRALYADLAENYAADADYEPGTVLSFGGSQEVTISSVTNDTNVAGVVSSAPATVMNSGIDAAHTATLALIGRVPTRVIGPVAKGAMMVSAGNGYAMACAAPAIGTVIGKAIENFDGPSGVIEIAVGKL